MVGEKLSQQDLANMVGASREMVNRILKDLSDRGFISIESKARSITIINRELAVHRWLDLRPAEQWLRATPAAIRPETAACDVRPLEPRVAGAALASQPAALRRAAWS